MTLESTREQDVRRIFEEQGFDASLLASWGGDLEHLAELMSEEDYEVLLDRLGDGDREGPA